MTYSRDAMAEPLRQLHGVLKSMADRGFFPCRTRSKRFVTKEGASMEVRPARHDDDEKAPTIQYALAMLRDGWTGASPPIAGEG